MWCSEGSNLIYRFGDVNYGKPNYYCYDRMKDVFNNYNKIILIISFSAGGLLGLMFFCNMYLCCCNEKNKDKSMHERFVYVVYTDASDDRIYRKM